MMCDDMERKKRQKADRVGCEYEYEYEYGRGDE